MKPEDYGMQDGRTLKNCPCCGESETSFIKDEHGNPKCPMCNCVMYQWSYKINPDCIHKCPDCGSEKYSFHRLDKYSWCGECKKFTPDIECKIDGVPISEHIKKNVSTGLVKVEDWKK